jgi:hypothetical protein
MKWWKPLFDVREENFIGVTFWIELPNIMLELWIDLRLRDIKVVLGHFIIVDDTYKVSSHRFVAKILVEMDPNQGIFKSMDRVIGECSYSQIHDYVNAHFSCS